MARGSDQTSATSMKMLTNLLLNEVDGSVEEHTNNTMDYHMAASTGNQHKSSIADLESKWKDIPDKYLIIIAQFLSGDINDTDAVASLNGPILKASIRSLYWIFLIQYAALAILGIVMNVAIIGYVMYHRLYKDVTHAFIVNLAFCHFVQCAVVLPISLMVMLIQNWIYGQFLCFFLPMLQDIPLHVAMMTHILIAWDRMRWLSDPLKGRFPAFVCCCTTWLTGMVIALPYPIYIIYVEIGDFVADLRGIGLCVVNLMDDMHEYMRGLFFLMYCGPAILLAYLYIRTSQELRPPDGPYAIMMYEHRADLRMRQRNSSASSVDRPFSASMGTTTTTSGIGTGLTTITTHTSGNGSLTSGAATRSYDLYSAEMDVKREKRKQRNFGSMAAAQVVCLCPLMILRFARLSVWETYENQKQLDFTYLMFVWIAFLPTVIFPTIYATQILPRNEQERLRGYFRLSTKRLHKARKTHTNMMSHDYSTSSRENSIEKDGDTTTTQATAIITNSGEGSVNNTGYSSSGVQKTHSDAKAKYTAAYKQQGKPQVNAKRDGKPKAAVSTRTGKPGSQKPDIKINIIKEGQHGVPSSAGRNLATANHAKPQLKPHSSNSSRRSSVNTAAAGNTLRKLTIDSVDTNSCSNMTASTYCNGTGSLLDDGGTSNFGDVEDSSIISGMLVTGNAGVGMCFDKKWDSSKHGSFSEGSTYSRMDSSSTLARDYDIIDMLERERSMNIQETLQREQQQQQQQMQSHAGERRLLPDIDKIIQRSPKPKLDPYNFDANFLRGADPLQANTSDSYSSRSSLNGNALSFTESTQLEGDNTLDVTEEEEEVPQDFFDNYTPGASAALPMLSPAGNAVQNAAVDAAAVTTTGYQYQYHRRLSRKSGSAHYSQAGSHRNSKRDSFNSLNGTDLIAGAFGELDPTQPLSKMSVIDNRMRRSSARNSSFSSSGRSSMKSRDYNHGSTHSAHPELDFRENIFAEL